jgi:hypothetical protein
MSAVPPPPEPTTVSKPSAAPAYIGVAMVLVFALAYALLYEPAVPATCNPSALSKDMTRAEVLAICGKPHRTDVDRYLGDNEDEFWFYGSGAVYFRNGRLRNAIWKGSKP